MKLGTFQKTIRMLREAFQILQVDMSLIELEKLAVMINKTMTQQARSFHTPEHVFDLADSSNAILSLAALFHDLVYYQVDLGFPPEIHQVVKPYVQETDGNNAIIRNIPSNDLGFTLTLEVFGFEPGQELSPFTGLNEFLSALVMNKVLEKAVREKDLLKITASIEATIPFRGKNKKGETNIETLEKRLIHINQEHQFSMDEAEIEETVKWALELSNKDVASFADKDSGGFLDNTWKLLPETNVALRSRNTYSIRDFRQALQKMRAFLGSITPDIIFHSYKGYPSEKEYQQMVDLAQTNLINANEYLGAKLSALAILEALSALTGGDAPLSMFMGDIEKENEQVERLEDFLPEIEAASSIEQSSVVYKLLDQGRTHETGFDILNSPLTLFLYKSLGPDRMEQLLVHANDMFEGTMKPQDFLAHIDKSTVAVIANACSSMVLTRRDALLQYALP